MTTDLHALVVKAVADAAILHPYAPRRIAATKLLSDADGQRRGVHEYRDAVQRVLDGPPITLTRADKESQVTAAVEALDAAVTAAEIEYQDTKALCPETANAIDQRKAELVRLAMARTVD